MRRPFAVRGAARAVAQRAVPLDRTGRWEPPPRPGVVAVMETTVLATERAWDARVARFLPKLPDRLRSGVEWLRVP